LADLHASELTIQTAVVQGTNKKQALAWSCSTSQKHRILSAFALAIREGRLGFSIYSKTIKSKSARATLDCVAQTYKLAERPDPWLDADKWLAFILQHQLRGYHVTDKPVTPQAAVNGSTLWEFHKISISSMDKAMCELFTGTFFFAMRSCKYLKVSGQRKTKLLCIKNIRFFRGKHLLLHNNKFLHLADSVSITFEQQKRDLSNETITHHRTNDKILCPVKIWCKIIRRIISYPSISPDNPVNSFLCPDGKLHYFTGTELLKHLRLATKALGESQIGLHSARSGAALAIYLAGVPVFTIMLLGWWSSDAFLHYIRKQVKEFSTGVSQKMIIHEDFYTVPISSQNSSNTALKLASRNKNGICFKDAVRPLINAFAWSLILDIT
jgi:hypothetical protein